MVKLARHARLKISYYDTLRVRVPLPVPTLLPKLLWMDDMKNLVSKSRMLSEYERSWLKVYAGTPAICSYCHFPAFFLLVKPEGVGIIWDWKPVRPDGTTMCRGETITCYFCGGYMQGFGKGNSLGTMEMLTAPPMV